jgi:ubiquinone/menaquinone biosynthesis C-methylase UbiE
MKRSRSTLRPSASVVARGAAPLLLRVGRRTRVLGPPFARFARDDGRSVQLLSGYRVAVKSTWPSNWWPVQALLDLAGRVELAGEAARLATAVAHALTLPAPVEDFVRALEPLRDEHPSQLRPTGRRDEALGVEILELVPREDEVQRKAAFYRELASRLRDDLSAHGLDVAGARILDAGTGSGYLAFALAGLGAAEVVGVDLDPVGYVMPGERERMLALLAGDHAARVRLESGDVHSLSFPDERFDLVCSMTAVEHFADLEKATAELTRVLDRRGLMLHGVEPWFSKRGGHGLLTLDFPWGHVRLTPSELRRYLEEVRPHEAESALAYHAQGFQRRPATLAESRAVFERHATVLEWSETPVPTLDPHRALATSGVLRDCRARFPAVTRRDLLTLTYTVIARRRWS